MLGPLPAATLMASLPPVQWDLLATKADLERFATTADMDHRFAVLDHRLEAMEHRITAAFRGDLTAAITAQTRTMIFGLLATVVAMGSFMLVATGVG
ncbi:MAG: hypothetical protein ACRD1K_14930 [Acidimicrobiales bacterium]